MGERRVQKWSALPLFLILRPFNLPSQNDGHAFYVLAHLDNFTGLIFPQLLATQKQSTEPWTFNSLTRMGQQFSLIYPKAISEETNVPNDTFLRNMVSSKPQASKSYLWVLNNDVLYHRVLASKRKGSKERLTIIQSFRFYSFFYTTGRQASVPSQTIRGIQLHGSLLTPGTEWFRISKGQATSALLILSVLLILAGSCIQTTAFCSKPTNHRGRKISIFTNHPLQNKLPRWLYYSFTYLQPTEVLGLSLNKGIKNPRKDSILLVHSYKLWLHRLRERFSGVSSQEVISTADSAPTRASPLK